MSNDYNYIIVKAPSAHCNAVYSVVEKSIFCAYDTYDLKLDADLSNSPTISMIHQNGIKELCENVLKELDAWHKNRS